MGENPLSSQSGFSAESMARGSASKILSNQLNNFAGNLIKGVELNFDLQSAEDYSTGQKRKQNRFECRRIQKIVQRPNKSYGGQ